MAAERSFAFVCLHGSAKSVLAAEYLMRAARARGIAASARAYGLEPDPAMPPHVVAGMAAKGLDVRGRIPSAATPDALARADHVISFCDVSALLAPGRTAQRWDACPAVSDGFDAAWDFITAEVDRLLAQQAATCGT